MDNQDLTYKKEKLKTQQFSCPNCGGLSVFSPTHQKLKCEYCSSLFDVPSDTLATEQNLNDLLNSNQNWNEAQVVQCKNCGGKQVVNNNGISAICSFCGSTNIVKTEELTGLAPQGVVPFHVEKEEVASLSKKWGKSKFFAPNSFKKQLSPQNINGVYYPVFTFDANTTSTYSGRLYKNYTRTHRDSQGRMHTTTERRYFNIRGTHNQQFDDVIIQASNGISQRYISVLEPFPTNKAIVYNPNFLNGYSALTYSKTGKVCWQEGYENIKNRIRSSILMKYTYSGVSSFNQETNILSVSYKYVLVPLYIGHFTYKNKLYNFYVNGYSGEVTGSAPVSGVKVALVVILLLFIFFGIPLIIFLVTSGTAFGFTFSNF